MTITVIGQGYVGLPTAALFADLGNKVFVLGRSQEKINNLKQGRVAIFEPGLEELVKKTLASGNLIPTTSYQEAIPESDVIFIAVGTPPGPQGEADLSQVFAAAQETAKYLNDYAVIVNKSTVPVGTAEKVEKIIKYEIINQKSEISVASCPEFLREGSALQDAYHPDRIVIGTNSDRARDLLLELHRPLPGERVVTDPKSAELIKYASNAFLATKISFINEIANICDNVGADIKEVARGMGLDSRIGSKFLQAGAGWSGSCFPKDVRALHHIALTNNYDPKLLKAVIEVNNDQRLRIIHKLEQALGNLEQKIIVLFGLAFKPHTDDCRESVSIDLMHLLKRAGARVRVCDPLARPDEREVFTDVEYTADPLQALANADAVVLVTEWPQFKEFDWQTARERMRQPILIDGRNFFDPKKMRQMGWNYICVGRQ